jgi:DNA-binding transcriptional regulator YhcF (GntR family)
MTTITLEYNYKDLKAQKTLEHILSLGFFKSAMSSKEETIAEKRKKLDRELKNYTVDLSNFKFNREEANIYE